jgi:hypothetical protein
MVAEVDDTPLLLTIAHDLNGLVQRSSVRLSEISVDSVTGKRYEHFQQWTSGFVRGQHAEATLIAKATELKNFIAASGYPAIIFKLGT